MSSYSRHPAAWDGQPYEPGFFAGLPHASSSRSASTASSTCSTSRPRADSAGDSARRRARRRGAVQPRDGAGDPAGGRGRRPADLLHLAEPAPAVSAAVPLVRAVRLPALAPRHRRQRRGGRGAARQGVSRAGERDPAVRGRSGPVCACRLGRRSRRSGRSRSARSTGSTPEKGVDVLLDAAARLPGDWRLRFVGNGPLRDVDSARARAARHRRARHGPAGSAFDRGPGRSCASLTCWCCPR